MGFVEWKKGRILRSVAEDGDKAVNILATSDIHTQGYAGIDATGASIIVLAGDVMGAGFRSDDAGEEFVKEVFIPFCNRFKDKQIVMTAGNHDKYLYRLWVKGKDAFFPSNVHYLVDEGCEVGGLRFWGTPWCTKDREGRFETDSRGLAERFSRIPKDLDVLISHSPPLVVGEKVDVYDGGHDGSAELTEAIMSVKPKVVVCGHVHGGSREMMRIGDTRVYNVARCEDDRSEEAYKPIVIRVSTSC